MTRTGRRFLRALLAACILLAVCAGCASRKTEEGLPFEKWPPREQVLNAIDAVIKDLNEGKIDEKEAVSKIKAAIPKPVGYPKKNIEVVIPWGAGGGSDLYMRQVGREAEKFLGVTMVYINMPGAQTEIGNSYAFGKSPDGYTLLSVNGTPVANQIFNPQLPYKFTEQFTPIFSGQGYSEAFFVKSDSPFKTWDDLVAWAKDNPGKLTVATVGPLTDDQFVLWKVEEHFGIKIVNMGFESSGERRTGVLGGHVVALADSIGTVTQLLQAGQLRPILYYGPVRFKEIDPNVPCMGDYGLEIKTLRWRGVAGPPNMPKEIQEYLFYVYYAAHQMPEYKKYEKQVCLHYSQPWAKGPEDLKKFWADFLAEGKTLHERYTKK